jgi:deoxyribodipyrimidine photo-lyase
MAADEAMRCAGIHPARVQLLNQLPPAAEGKYVLYWMQQSQRAQFNHALEYAVEAANIRQLPVVVVFGLTPSYPEANERHYAFMLEGLRDVAVDLAERRILFVLANEAPVCAVLRLAAGAGLVVTDCGYLRIQKQWRAELARKAKCALVQIESDVVVPVQVVSQKEEYAARTIRPRIHAALDEFLKPVARVPVKYSSLSLKLGGLEPTDPAASLKQMRIDRSVSRVSDFHGGSREAARRLRSFMSERLPGYAERRNHPALDHTSHLSAYLHFGQISPLQVALAVMETPRSSDRDAFLEELIVRRELSMNFAHYSPQYDSYDCLPAWAQRTLQEHARDPRESAYSLEQFEAAATHDPCWNAAQFEMLRTGTMHNTMRMYWGKKILEWSRTPQEAFEIALYLNNRYQLDGRDANSFAGVAWCFGKHDRPWSMRPVFGTVRYMNAAGLRRKYDMDSYVRRVAPDQLDRR